METSSSSFSSSSFLPFTGAEEAEWGGVENRIRQCHNVTSREAPGSNVTALRDVLETYTWGISKAVSHTVMSLRISEVEEAIQAIESNTCSMRDAKSIQTLLGDCQWRRAHHFLWQVIPLPTTELLLL